MEIIQGQGGQAASQQEWDEANLFLIRSQAMREHQRAENAKGVSLLLLLVCTLIALCTPAIIWAVWSWAV